MIDLQTPNGDAVLFENADWHVLGDGIEHRETGYFIARDSVGRRSESGLWEWPLHLAEKSWCAPRAFRDAFLAALDLFGVGQDDKLGQSFVAGFGLRMGNAGMAGTDGFTRLAELVRPRSIARRRSDVRSAGPWSASGRTEEIDGARAVRS